MGTGSHLGAGHPQWQSRQKSCLHGTCSRARETINIVNQYILDYLEVDRCDGKNKAGRGVGAGIGLILKIVVRKGLREATQEPHASRG